MAHSVFPFLLVCVCILAEVATLILARDKTGAWQRSMYASIGVNGFSALGYAAPFVYPYPAITFLLATSIMMVGVAWSYYNAPVASSVTFDQRMMVTDQRARAIRYVVFGIILTIGLSVIVGYTQGQKRGTEVQESFTSAVVRLSDEISSLGKLITNLDKRLQVVESQMNGAKTGQDSVLANQKEGLKNQEELKKAVKPRRR